MLTKEQFLDLIKDSNSLKNRIESNNNHKSNEKIAVLNEPKGKFFTESEEIPTENRKAIENREHSMNGLALKNVDFTESLSNDQVPSHYIYLEKQFPALKITVNSPVQNSRTIKPKDFVVKEKEPIFGEKTINRVNIMIGSNSDLLEERDKISNLDELYNSIKNVNLKNDSNDLPSFGFNNFGSQMGFGSNVSLEADYVKEKKKLLGDLEILQQKEREIEKKRKNLHESEQRNCLLRSIKEKNQKINIMKQKFRDFRKMNEAVGNENAYLKQLQQKHYELRCDNRLFKHLLKISSITNLNGFSSVNSGSAQKPPKIVVSSVNHRKNSSRSFKMDDRGSAPSGEIEKMSVGLKKNSDNFFLKDIEFTTNLQENVQRLKICCLKNKGLLFKNQEIQIGVLSDLQNYKEKKLWKIYIYVENISQNNMITNIFMRFKASDNITLWAKSQEEFINVLRYQEQNYKEIVIDYKTIPFNFALLDIKYQYLNKITRNIIALPNSIIKLVNFLEIEIQELIDFWKKNKQSSKNSEEFQINPNFSNFKTFFPFLSEKISQNIKKEDLDKKVFYSKFKVLGVEGIIKLKSNFHQKNTGKITGVLKIMLVDNNKENPLNLRDFLLDSFKFLLVKV